MPNVHLRQVKAVHQKRSSQGGNHLLEEHARRRNDVVAEAVRVQKGLVGRLLCQLLARLRPIGHRARVWVHVRGTDLGEDVPSILREAQRVHVVLLVLVDPVSRFTDGLIGDRQDVLPQGPRMPGSSDQHALFVAHPQTRRLLGIEVQPHVLLAAPHIHGVGGAVMRGLVKHRLHALPLSVAIVVEVEVAEVHNLPVSSARRDLLS
mmetsp:Transcript_101976/g.263576  ORF Transcript_101976/g.263576 Transcript_101976/m.263576 type:complete len:206 (-) Transcript_101976:1164-1781(-)